MTTDVYAGGLPFSNAGVLQVIPRPAGGVGTNVAKVRGIAVELAGGMVYVEDAGAAVPSTAFYVGGIALTADGAIYVTQSTDGSFFWNAGIKTRSDGAVSITNGAPVAGTWGGLGAQGADGGISILGNGFAVELQTSLVPWLYNGSSTPTYTRATVAFQTDFEGKLNAVLSGEARFQGGRRVRNLVPNSGTLTAAAGWSLASITNPGSATTVAPDGTTTGWLFTASGANGQFYKAITSTAGNSFTNSIWLKRNLGTGPVLIFDESGGTVVIDISAQLSSSEWKRFAVTSTSADVTSYTGFEIRTSGDKVEAWHPQYEDVTGQANQNPSEYVSVGVESAPFHGAGVDGVKNFSTLNGNTVASNVVTEATGAHIDSSQAAAAGGVTAGVVDAYGPLGYLAEGARTNLFLWASDWTNVAWVKTTMTTAKTSTGPDGIANSATRLTASGAAATVLQLLVAAASDRTWSVWARRVTGTGTIKLFQGLTTTADLASSLNSTTYSLIQLDATVDITLLGAGVEIGTSGDAIDVWVGQFEAGSYASSPIQTTTVAVTRNADVLTYPSAGNISDTQGTMYAEIKTTFSAANEARYFLSTNISTRFLYLPANQATTSIWVFDGTTELSKTGLSDMSTAVRKRASSWGGSTMSIIGDGAAPATGAFDGSFGVATTLLIGDPGFATIRNVRIYPTALPAATLQTLTT